MRAFDSGGISLVVHSNTSRSELSVYGGFLGFDFCSKSMFRQTFRIVVAAPCSGALRMSL